MPEIAEIDTTAIEAESTALLATVNTLAVSSAPEAEYAGKILREIKAFRARVRQTFEAPIKAAHAAHKAILAARDKHDQAPAEAERIVKGKLSSYTREEDRKREEEEQRRRREAIEQEKRRRVEAATRSALAGEQQKAKEILAQPIVTPPIVAPPPTPKIEGVSTRTIWRYRIIGPDLLPRKFLIPDEKALASYARSMREKAVGTVPGVEFYSEQTVAARI